MKVFQDWPKAPEQDSPTRQIVEMGRLLLETSRELSKLMLEAERSRGLIGAFEGLSQRLEDLTREIATMQTKLGSRAGRTLNPMGRQVGEGPPDELLTNLPAMDRDKTPWPPEELVRQAREAEEGELLMDDDGDPDLRIRQGSEEPTPKMRRGRIDDSLISGQPT